ncbi:MAG: M56 family metallopeptidase [Gemmatimonadaceae bacterium]
MAILCFLYFFAVATCLGIAGLLVEHALPATASRRWVWCVVILASVVVPILFSLHRSAPVIEIWGYTLLHIPTRHAMGATSHGSSALAWFDCSRATYGKFLLQFSSVWTVVLVLWAVVSNLRAWYLIRRARASREGGRPTEVDGVPVVVTESLGPATIGLLRARVLLPRWVIAMPAVQRRYVVRHEDEHRKARDPLLLGAASILVALLAWNLPLWWQLRRLGLAIETDCDRRVVRALGGEAEYGNLLFTVAQAANRAPLLLQPALLGRSGMLERRLTLLLDAAPRSTMLRWLAPVLAGALVYLVLSIPHPIPG